MESFVMLVKTSNERGRTKCCSDHRSRPFVSVSKPRAEVGAEVGAKARTLCWACDGANDDDAKFCKHCGSTLAAGEAEARCWGCEPSGAGAFSRRSRL